MAGKIRIASSQFPVGPSVLKNLNYIRKQIIQASQQGATLVHFSECCLSGYGGFDFEKYDSEQQSQIEKGIAEIQNLAKQHKIWVIFGSHFFEGNQKKPYNSLFVINSIGEIEIRYDKRCVGGNSRLHFSVMRFGAG